jgi:hypothetical protein
MGDQSDISRIASSKRIHTIVYSFFTCGHDGPQTKSLSQIPSALVTPHQLVAAIMYTNDIILVLSIHFSCVKHAVNGRSEVQPCAKAKAHIPRSSSSMRGLRLGGELG